MFSITHVTLSVVYHINWRSSIQFYFNLQILRKFIINTAFKKSSSIGWRSASPLFRLWRHRTHTLQLITQGGWKQFVPTARQTSIPNIHLNIPVVDTSDSGVALGLGEMDCRPVPLHKPLPPYKLSQNNTKITPARRDTSKYLKL